MVTGVVRAAGLRTEPEIGAVAGWSVQMLEIAIDATDIAAIRPFWKAVFGFAGEAGAGGPEDVLADPAGQCPAIWFQQMSEPRTERNHIHFDIFWVFADPEGNEALHHDLARPGLEQ